jgi:hypothetical protein
VGGGWGGAVLDRKILTHASTSRRELDSIRASSTTPSREQIAMMLANLLLEMDDAKAPNKTAGSRQASSTCASRQDKDPRWAPAEAAGRTRPNALTPSKQKQLHQIVRRFGKESSQIFEACQAVASASSEAQKAEAMQALRDQIVKDASRQATERSQHKLAEASARQHQVHQ